MIVVLIAVDGILLVHALLLRSWWHGVEFDQATHHRVGLVLDRSLRLGHVASRTCLSSGSSLLAFDLQKHLKAVKHIVSLFHHLVYVPDRGKFAMLFLI